MHRRRRPSFRSGPAGGRGNVFYTSNAPDSAVPPTSHIAELPSNPSLAGPPTEQPHQALRDEHMMHIQESEYQDPHQNVHQQQGPKHDGEQQSRGQLILDEHRSALLSNSYTDFLASLRNSEFGCDWIFGWALSQYASHDDATRLDLGLSRGFRVVHMCAERGCLSMEGKTALQSSATLLLPVQSRDSIVVGYFMEVASDESAPQLRTGKYVYFPASRELLKVSKVRGPLNAAALSSVCINRICRVGHGGFVQDHIMASFSWQHGAAKVPAQYVVHSRTLSFSKMVQTAKDAGFAGYGSVGDGVSMVGEGTGNLGVLENSFYGIGEFGVFASAIVPSRLGFGAQAEGNETPFSVGHWAVPSHALGCRNIQTLLLGIQANEIASLRSQFVTAYGHVSAQVPRQAPSGVSTRPNQSQVQVMATERLMPGHQRLDPTGTFNQTSVRSMELLSLSAENAAYGQKGIVPSNEAQGLKDARAVGLAGNPPAIPFTAGAQRLDANVVVHEDDRGGPVTKKTTGIVPNVPGYVATSLMLPIQPQLHTARAHPFNSPVEEALKGAPSSVVESIEAVVAAQQGPSSSGDQIAAGSPAGTAAAQGTTFGAGPLGSGVQGAEDKKQDISTMSSPTFKKTLPAPTKNEIVIRNRISAQRSNEKRRRKIEATKNELAFLRTTYLPQLENRKGSLVSENRNLRQEFMQKYHQQQEIESFF